jgi:hypothetical protein
MAPLLLARAALWGAVAGTLPALALAAQDSVPAPARVSAVGAGVELWAAGDQAVPILTIKAGWYRAGALGVEVGVGGLPQPVLIPEAGLSYQVRAGEAWIVVRGGLSPLVHPFGGWLGAYGGAGVILPAREAGIRLDVTRRALSGGAGLWSIGIAIVSRPGG